MEHREGNTVGRTVRAATSVQERHPVTVASNICSPPPFFECLPAFSTHTCLHPCQMALLPPETSDSLNSQSPGNVSPGNYSSLHRTLLSGVHPTNGWCARDADLQPSAGPSSFTWSSLVNSMGDMAVPQEELPIPLPTSVLHVTLAQQ